MDLDNLFARIQKQYASDLPFVIYRKPNKEIIRGVVQKDDKLYVSSKYTESGFVFAPFDTDLNGILFPLEKCDLHSGFYVQKNDFTENPKLSKLTPENEFLKSTHIELINKGIASIKENDFKKVVLSRKEEVKVSDLSSPAAVIELFKNLLEKYPSAFVYCWYHPMVGTCWHTKISGRR